MTGAMYAAIGGLKTHMANLNVIGNNIANVNTPGYKAQRMTFQESIYATSKSGSDGGVTTGGNNPSQIGYGSSIGSIDLNMTPGTYNPTGFGLDCMIDGEGFFMVGDKNLNINSAEDLSKPLLTRVGNFWKDPEGYICDRNGNVLYGYATVYNPDYDPTLTDEQIEEAKQQGKNVGPTMISTQLVPLRLPLAADVPTDANGGKDGDTYNWTVGDPVYGMLSTATGANDARVNVSLAENLKDYVDDTGKFDPTKFNADGGIGRPIETSEPGADGTNTVTYGNIPDAVIKKIPIPNTNDKVISVKNLSINKQGAITCTCDNGQSVVVGYAAIANVASPDGVTHVDGPYYKAMEGAGDISVSGVGGVLENKFLNNQTVVGEGEDTRSPATADAIGLGSGIEIKNGGLEMSGADVATEFSNMILTQRGYQANTRIVTVTDSMLEELVNMKR